MTDDIPEGLQAQAKRLGFAQENYERLATNIMHTIERLGADVPVDELPTNVSKLLNHYEAALVHVNKQEAEYAKQHDAINGVIQGGACDLAEAQTEILGRIANLRERTRG